MTQVASNPLYELMAPPARSAPSSELVRHWLRAIGVEKAQGYFLGRPMSTLGALALAREHSVVDCAAAATPTRAVG